MYLDKRSMIQWYMSCDSFLSFSEVFVVALSKIRHPKIERKDRKGFHQEWENVGPWKLCHSNFWTQERPGNLEVHVEGFLGCLKNRDLVSGKSICLRNERWGMVKGESQKFFAAKISKLFRNFVGRAKVIYRGFCVDICFRLKKKQKTTARFFHWPSSPLRIWQAE